MLKKELQVPYFSLMPKGCIKVKFFLEFFQEFASEDAIRLGMGVAHLKEKGITWVLRRYHLDFWNEKLETNTIHAETFCEAYKNLFSIRVFYVHSLSGAKLCRGWSSWVLYDPVSGRPLRLDRAMTESYKSSQQDTGQKYDEPIGEVLNPDEVYTFQVRQSELDINAHVNHTVYFEWIQESVPGGLNTSHYLSSVDAEFFYPITQGSVSVQSQRLVSEESKDEPVVFIHSVSGSGSDLHQGKICARVRSVWRSIS